MKSTLCYHRMGSCLQELTMLTSKHKHRLAYFSAFGKYATFLLLFA